ncbi:MAG: D-alanine--D-alanine ligase [Candidatus Omnitrophica bacterium]|jgi:D-alanine--D-alanine ligase|nr:D-alanine--D-alanine ligase [Candidatus Omnitrophota bacterium]MDD5078794.1 D-alanine--D-alanine ligase [Candidatus Omnitrophota bacterium]
MEIDTKKFGRIGVLMGGPSSEREISLRSAKGVCDSLRELGLEFVPIDILTDNPDENIRLVKSHKIDCAFIALHGYFGEDGKIQAILEGLNIPFTCSGSKASSLAMDKAASHRIFIAAGLKVPRFVLLADKANAREQAGNCDFGLPWVVKPVMNGSSIGLSIIDQREGLDKALDEAFAADRRVLIEEYINGRELTVGILGDEPMAVVEIIPKSRFFDYDAKYRSGDTEYIVPAELDEDTCCKVKACGLAAHKALGCYGCSRVDIILGRENTPYVLELNNIPGLTATSLLPKAARSQGIDFKQLCVRMLELAYEKK